VKERQDSRSVACLLLGFSGFEAPRVEGFFFGSIRDSSCGKFFVYCRVEGFFGSFWVSSCGQFFPGCFVCSYVRMGALRFL
jgi:hypothetical protein